MSRNSHSQTTRQDCGFRRRRTAIPGHRGQQSGDRGQFLTQAGIDGRTVGALLASADRRELLGRLALQAGKGVRSGGALLGSHYIIMTFIGAMFRPRRALPPCGERAKGRADRAGASGPVRGSACKMPLDNDAGNQMPDDLIAAHEALTTRLQFVLAAIARLAWKGDRQARKC